MKYKTLLKVVGCKKQGYVQTGTSKGSDINSWISDTERRPLLHACNRRNDYRSNTKSRAAG
ncbi:MAG: hypothetical protein FWE45_03335 [Firmicutes bacterium]|nr:hypothetical protein [Bacillota bacterium]